MLHLHGDQWLELEPKEPVSEENFQTGIFIGTLIAKFEKPEPESKSFK